MTGLIFHMAAAADWAAAQQSGRYRGSPDDLRDGFLHFSTWAQLPVSAARHRAGRADQILIAVDPAMLGDDLRWEPSRGGDLFPHLYAELVVSMIAWAVPLPLGADGRHQLPVLP